MGKRKHRVMQSFTVTYSDRDGTATKAEVIEARSSREAHMRAKEQAGRLHVSVEPTKPPPPAVRHLAVPSADFWFQLAKAQQEGRTLPERLLYMENAVNHLESQLIAERQSRREDGKQHASDSC